MEDFGKSYSLGARSEKLLWDYGRLAEREHPDDAIKALNDLHSLNPSRLDVRLELAALQLNSRHPGVALSVLADVRSVTAEDAPRFFTLMASAQIQLGDREGARVTVAKLAANAKTPEDRTRVEQMQRYLEQPASRAPAAVSSDTVSNPSSDVPRLARPAQAQSSAVPAPAPEIEGSFTEFVCLEKSFKVVLDTAQGKKAFLIPNPNQIVVVGRAGGKVDLNCGPQAPVHVKIEYTPAPAGADADGILKILYFDP